MEVDGLSVTLDRELRIGTLRYLDCTGAFAACACQALGGPLPEPLHAAAFVATANRGEIILAWRSPTETLVLSFDQASFSKLEIQLASAADGCMVDQSGGIWAVRVCGPRIGDLLLRLGATASIPAVGEARTSRIAELSVLALCVRAGEVLLLVERVYADHLLEWIRATIRDS